MKGLEWYNPLRIRTPGELVNYINEVGFLPLFANGIDGFSVEEHVSPDFWWTGDPEQDPWAWREIIAENKGAAYGKFFDGKSGFISREWLPVFANYRRAGCTFEELWQQARVNMRCRKIMDQFETRGELYGHELKKIAGFSKDGEKNFEGTVVSLQHQTFLVVSSLRQKIRKDGVPYGWPVSVYAKPESLFGEEHVLSAFHENPADSEKKIRERVRFLFGSDGGMLIGAPYKEQSFSKIVLPEPEW